MEKVFETATIEELLGQNTDGSIPVLIDIQHDDITWSENTSDYTGDQENGHLRLINANFPVMYKGDSGTAHRYMPSVFKFTLPSENGKEVGSTSITISAIDQRVIEVIRSVSTKPKAVIEAFFMRSDDTIMFSRLYRYEFEMNSVSWDGVSAKWNLVFDPAMQLNVPRDLATQARCPAVVQQ